MPGLSGAPRSAESGVKPSGDACWGTQAAAGDGWDEPETAPLATPSPSRYRSAAAVSCCTSAATSDADAHVCLKLACFGYIAKDSFAQSRPSASPAASSSTPLPPHPEPARPSWGRPGAPGTGTMADLLKRPPPAATAPPPDGQLPPSAPDEKQVLHLMLMYSPPPIPHLPLPPSITCCHSLGSCIPHYSHSHCKRTSVACSVLFSRLLMLKLPCICRRSLALAPHLVRSPRRSRLSCMTTPAQRRQKVHLQCHPLIQWLSLSTPCSLVVCRH